MSDTDELVEALARPWHDLNCREGVACPDPERHLALWAENPSLYGQPNLHHAAAALAPIVAARVEAARAEAVAAVLALAKELEGLVGQYTVAHPENTMRVLELLWQDQHRIATDLRAAVSAEGVAAHNRAVSSCECPPCPGRGNDGHVLTHCAECCMGTGVEADLTCPIHGDPSVTATEPVVGNRAERAAGWDECLQALAWAEQNGPREHAYEYVRKHNPYRADALDGGDE